MPSELNIQEERQFLKNWLEGGVLVGVAFENVSTSEDFVLACNNLTNRLLSLNSFLSPICDNYQKDRTINLEELSHVVISATIIQLRNCSLSLRSFYLANVCKSEVAYLESYIDYTCNHLRKIWNLLCYDIVEDSYAMARYGKTMLDRYGEGAFLYHREVMPLYFMPCDKKHNLNKASNNARSKIVEFFDEVIDTDNNKVNLVTLGRYLWTMRTKIDNNDPENSILFWIKVYEFHMCRSGYKTIYSDIQKSVADGESNEDKHKRAADAMAKVKGILIDKCCNLFNDDEGRWKILVATMLDDMLESDCKFIVSERVLSPDRIVKFAHQVAGLLHEYRVYDDCTLQEVAMAMDFTNPDRSPNIESRQRYMRNNELEDEVKVWIVNYLTSNGGKKRR